MYLQQLRLRRQPPPRWSSFSVLPLVAHHTGTHDTGDASSRAHNNRTHPSQPTPTTTEHTPHSPRPHQSYLSPSTPLASDAFYHLRPTIYVLTGHSQHQPRPYSPHHSSLHTSLPMSLSSYLSPLTTLTTHRLAYTSQH
ncbi:hypothetical protein Hamer_G022589 [Homarus americanus]|uniref:Uncharacterized protein n=1 Tax=Homarus americanus TaxID=6706 RepID=A0A8J5MLR2_HOMAM|nr:hypothetical protein Hamer_G022589 [Homarus americanus]